MESLSRVETIPVSLVILPTNINVTTNATMASSMAADLLSLLTVVGSSLSLVGLVFSFITYSLFSDLRTLAGTTVMNLFAAMFLSQLLFVVGVERTSDQSLCLGLAFSLHYLALAVFFWIASMTHDLYVTFKDNVNLQPVFDLRLRANFCKYTVISWGIPALLLGSALVMHFGNHASDTAIITNSSYSTLTSISTKKITSPPHSFEEMLENNCWLVDTSSLLYTLALPMVFLTIFEAIYFVRTAIVIRYIASMQMNRKTKRKMSKKRYLQLFLYAKIFLLVAVTWTCAFLAKGLHSGVFWVAFQILFALQGVLVALAYTCNSRVFKIYSKTFQPPKKDPTYGTSDLSQSTSLQLLSWEPPPDAV